MRLVIFGAGYSGKAIAGRLAGEAERVVGTSRSEDGLAAISATGARALVFDGRSIGPELARELSVATHLVMSISPDHGGDPLLPLLAGRLAEAAPRLGWIGYLSTVGVYGDHAGAWVDEESECRPVSKRSLARRDAEERWMALGRSAGMEVALIRLSGIYGPDRNALRKVEDGTARRIVKPGQVFNRIHVSDIAGASALLAQKRLGGPFNVTDDEPAPPQDLISFAASLMGVVPPPEIDFETAELSPMARSFYGENKRVSNARIKRAGYSFEYPDYRMALRRMWENSEW